MKILQGVVTSTKMQKSAVVEVSTRSMHPKYKKIVSSTKKYLIHDENETANEGDTVRIIESRPMSKRKRFRLLEVVNQVE